MSSCCGKDIIGNFCQDCGKANQSKPPIETLITHLKAGISQKTKQLSELRELAKRNPDSPVYSYQRKIPQAEIQLAKWTGWLRVVQEVVENEKQS